MTTSFFVLEARTTQQRQLQEALGRVVHLEAALASTQSTLAQVTAERDKLRRAYEQLKEQLELLRRRIFVGKAERVDVAQLEMEFAQTLAKLDALATQLAADAEPPPADPPPPPAKSRPKPTGRRDLGSEEMPEERIEIFDPALEGKAERIGFEESSGWAIVVRARSVWSSRGRPTRSSSRSPAKTPRATSRSSIW